MDIRFLGVPAASSQKAGPAQKTGEKKSADFEGALSTSSSQKVTAAEKVPELMAGVQELANDLKQGKITKEEAGRQFVSMVIGQQTHLKGFVKDTKKMESAVADAIEQDPFFVAKLETQLKKMGQEG